MIMLLANNHYYHEEGDTACWGYTTHDYDSQEQTDVSAQDLLKFIVGFTVKNNQRIAWRSVLQELNNIKSKRELLAELSQKIGSTVQYILHLVPKTKQPILNVEWYDYIR